MSLLSPYKGIYVSVKSASDELNCQSIINGCDAVISDASRISDLSSKINGASSLIDSKAMSFDGETISGVSEECCNGVNGCQGVIIDTVSQIKEMAITIYNQLQEQYNYEAKEKDRVLQEQHNG